MRPAINPKMYDIAALIARSRPPRPADPVVFAAARDKYMTVEWPLIGKWLKNGQGIVVDVKPKLDRLRKHEGADLCWF